MSADRNAYWAAVKDEVAALSDSNVSIEELPERSNETCVVYAVWYEGIGGYPLFAYLTLPRGDGPFVPLFQAPGYASVVGVPSRERSAKYAVFAPCHRGQRLADSGYQAAYPGLLTDGLPGASSYIWRSVVADSLRAIDVFLGQPEVDGSKLAIAGNDLGALVASLRPDVKSLLVVTPLLLTDPPGRASDTFAYPMQEYNDFKRTYSDQWNEALETLSLFDPTAGAADIQANTMIACTGGEICAANDLMGAIAGEAGVYKNEGRGFIDHTVQEDWLAEATGVPITPGPFLPR
jgi:cephalosporin-C deacetylase-like acetyl esterase